MRGLLLQSMTDPRNNGRTLERLELLVPFAPDPRLSDWIIGILSDPPYNASVSRTNKFFKRVFQLLIDLRDPGLLARARALPEVWPTVQELNPAELEELDKRLSKILPELEEAYGAAASSLELSAREAELLDEVTAAIGTRPAAAVADERAADELLAAVFANPEADEPRQIYADFLMDLGDPLGEMIALQLEARRRKLKPAERKRVRDTLAAHGDRHLGRIAERVQRSGRVFERGFLVEARVTQLDSDPAWSTLRVVTGAVPESDDHHLVSLEELGGFRSAHALERLTSLKKPLGKVHSIFWHGPFSDYRGNWVDTATAFTTITCLPALRRLSMVGSSNWVHDNWFRRPTDFAWLWRAPVAATLKELLLPAHPSQFSAWHEAMRVHGLTRLTLCSTAEGYFDGGWQVTLQHTGDISSAQLLLSPPKSLGKKQPRRYVVVKTPLEQLDRLLQGLLQLQQDSLTGIVLDSSCDGKLTHQQQRRLDELVTAHPRAELTLARVARVRSPFG